MSRLRLYANGDTPEQAALYWQLLRDDILRYGAGWEPLLDKVDLAAVQSVQLILPAESALLHETELPGRWLSRQQQLLAYDLEPYLLEDLAGWHLAPLRHQGSRSVTLAALRHTRMQAWCAWLDQQFPGIRHELVLDSWLLETQQPLLWRRSQRTLLIDPPWRAWPCSGETLDLLLESLGLARPALRETEEEAEPLFRALPERPLPNLLQGAYSQQRLPGWVNPALAASMVLCAALLGLTWQSAALTGELRGELQQHRQHNVASYRELFPAAKNIVNVRAQLKNQRNRLRQGATVEGPRQGFLEGLAHLAETLKAQASPQQLDRLIYQKNGLTLSVRGPSVESMQQLNKALNQAPYRAELRSAQQTPEGFSALLEMVEMAQP